MIEELWDKAFVIASRDAAAEMHKKSTVSSLSWQEVFDVAYELNENLN